MVKIKIAYPTQPSWMTTERKEIEILSPEREQILRSVKDTVFNIREITITDTIIDLNFIGFNWQIKLSENTTEKLLHKIGFFSFLCDKNGEYPFMKACARMTLSEFFHAESEGSDVLKYLILAGLLRRAEIYRHRYNCIIDEAVETMLKDMGYVFKKNDTEYCMFRKEVLLPFLYPVETENVKLWMLRKDAPKVFPGYVLNKDGYFKFQENIVLKETETNPENTRYNVSILGENKNPGYTAEDLKNSVFYEVYHADIEKKNYKHFSFLPVWSFYLAAFWTGNEFTKQEIRNTAENLFRFQLSKFQEKIKLTGKDIVAWLANFVNNKDRFLLPSIFFDEGYYIEPYSRFEYQEDSLKGYSVHPNDALPYILQQRRNEKMEETEKFQVQKKKFPENTSREESFSEHRRRNRNESRMFLKKVRKDFEIIAEKINSYEKGIGLPFDEGYLKNTFLSFFTTKKAEPFNEKIVVEEELSTMQRLEKLRQTVLEKSKMKSSYEEYFPVEKELYENIYDDFIESLEKKIFDKMETMPQEKNEIPQKEETRFL